ncbi:hypothetical protein LOK46_07835 [Methylobacterium sp. NMS14P]|uniref:hypothetical protein n=1 Tax=Methylobacterium sp. NMS14P TaxID=2894310 RepID=UPI002358E349|nr:hypothetical protein [Methylobacterium sp. NMS14P]WCS26723.1 hypothetical protein LOK46_07835 [Methylobacterium sp. NMS14P]
MTSEITLRDLLNRAHNNTPLEIQLRIQAAETPAEMLQQLERALALAIGQLVRNRKYKHDLSEDQRTVELVSLLQMAGFPAYHDVKIGGHTDISVEMRDGFLWIGEAKNWTGKAWIFKGFRQLMTRYATGLPNQNNGAMIIYFDQENAGALLGKWEQALARRWAFTEAVEKVSSLQFNSAHPHKGSGETFYVKHHAVPLYWKPEDS